MDLSDLKDAEALEKEALRAAITDFIAITNDFAAGIEVVRFGSTRHAPIQRENLTYRLADDLLESAIAASTNVEAGCLNPALRELRYILEQCIKYASIDERFQSHDLGQRLRFMRFRKVELLQAASEPSHLIAADTRSQLLSALGRLYGRLSEYVHPSLHQAEERIARDKLGYYLGRHTSKDVQRLTSIAVLVYDISLLFYCHPLGFSLIGDAFLSAWESSVGWTFHHTPYMYALSQRFNYKFERRNAAGGPVHDRVRDWVSLLEQRMLQMA